MRASHPTLPKDGLPIATAYTVATSRKVLNSSLRQTSTKIGTLSLIYGLS